MLLYLFLLYFVIILSFNWLSAYSWLNVACFSSCATSLPKKRTAHFLLQTEPSYTLSSGRHDEEIYFLMTEIIANFVEFRQSQCGTLVTVLRQLSRKQKKNNAAFTRNTNLINFIILRNNRITKLHQYIYFDVNK